MARLDICFIILAPYKVHHHVIHHHPPVELEVAHAHLFPAGTRQCNAATTVYQTPRNSSLGLPPIQQPLGVNRFTP